MSRTTSCERALEHLVLDAVELVGDLVEDREAVVEEVVEDLVEQATRSAGEELLAEDVVLLAPREEARDRAELAVRDRDDVVVPDEEVELGGVQPLHLVVVEREVEDGEEVAVVLVVVDLRALALRDDVLDVERMPAEARGELLRRLDVGRDDVDPGQAASGELVDDRRRARWPADARARERRMRGRLGMGTQRVVLRQRHVLDCSPGASRSSRAALQHREKLGRKRDGFLLDPRIAYFNHGGYGACPVKVFAEYQRLQRELERDPTTFSSGSSRSSCGRRGPPSPPSSARRRATSSSCPMRRPRSTR